MNLIDLYARNPYKYDIGEKVMGYDIFRTFQFICGNIIDREHRGETNAYIIKSEHGDHFSGTLFENAIRPYDEKLVLEEIRRTIGDDNTRVLTLRIVFRSGVSIIIEEKGKEVVKQEIEGDDVDPNSLLESYKKLLTYLGFKPDLERLYGDDCLLVLNFIKEVDKNI